MVATMIAVAALSNIDPDDMASALWDLFDDCFGEIELATSDPDVWTKHLLPLAAMRLIESGGLTTDYCLMFSLDGEPVTFAVIDVVTARIVERAGLQGSWIGSLACARR